MANVPVATILVTDDCPLNCRYCNLRDEMDVSRAEKRPQPSTKDIIRIVQNLIDENPSAERYQITFSGGEPFMQWPKIRDTIIHFEDRKDDITWDFNTSGYLLNDEIIRWLANYTVTWNLSVDGGRRVTNYMRPTRYGGTPYFDRLKEVVPTLIYWFPQVYAKIIVSKRTIKELYHSYLELEQIGFRHMFLILDMTERDDLVHENIWTEDDYEELTEQLRKIVNQRALGMARGIERMDILQMEEIIEGLMNPPEKITPFDLVCGVCASRALTSMLNVGGLDRSDECYQGIEEFRNTSKEEFTQYLSDKLEECQGRCPKDPSCILFGNCAKRTCVKDNIEIRKHPYDSEEAFCMRTRCLGIVAIEFLELCNELCPNSKKYENYLRKKVK